MAMVTLVHTISQRIARYLEKVGLVERDMGNSFLNLPVDDKDSLLQLQGASVSYRIALGPQQGQKVFTLQTLPASNEGEYGQVANTSGFSLHAGVFSNADEPDKLERLCRYISRPAISEQRLNMTQNTKVRYELKTPYRDGTDYRLAHTYSLILSTSLVSYRPSFHHPDSTSPDFLACLRLTVIFAHKLQHRNVAKIALESLTKEMSNQINPIKQKV
jgi:hypothetical protein